MIEKGYSLETFFRVYDDQHGCFYQVRPDSDGLDCVEVTYHDDGNEDVRRCLTCPPAMARLIARALVEQADRIDACKHMETLRKPVASGSNSSHG